MLDDKELLAKYRITPEQIEQRSKAYEASDYPHEDGTVYTGSHLDAVGKKRITVVFDASTAQTSVKLKTRPPKGT